MGCLCFVDNKLKIQNKFKLEDSLSSYIINNEKEKENKINKKSEGKVPNKIKSNKLIYDVIFSCDSLKNLYYPEKGWKYFMTDKFNTRLSKEKNKTEDNFCPIYIIGDSNKGKTLLQIY